MRALQRLRNSRGFTIPELLVVMAIFVIVIMITSTSFKTVMSQVAQQSKSMETEIGSLVGLEMFRSDLQNAGYGLPWAFQHAPLTTAYTEIGTDDTTMPIGASFWPSGVSPRSFNDATGGIPRAILSGNTVFNSDGTKGSQYLVVKSMLVAPGVTQRKSITVTYNDNGRNPYVIYTDKPRATPGYGDSPSRNFIEGTGTERVIVIRNTFIDNIPTRQLQVSDGTTLSQGTFYTTFNRLSGFGGYTTLTQPHSSGDVFEVYGVDPATNPRMPFNRADYYVRTPDRALPEEICAPHTGVLYKAVASQTAGGGFTEMPLLDCVADMQVVFGMGPVGSNEINYHDTALHGTGPSGAATAKEIREQLKEIRVYILAHEGKLDRNFVYPQQTIDVGENFGGGLMGRTFNLSDRIGTIPAKGISWQNYRWKLYTIVVRPKNLIQ